MPEDVSTDVTSPQPSTGVGLAEVLPFLVGLGRTGRLSAEQGEAPALEVWIERGRVVDAAWGPLRALSALELGAVFLPRASFVFSDGLQSETPTFELSPTDLAVRLAEVAREGVALARSIPGPSAVPAKLNLSRQAHDPEAVRLLDQIDGHRSVAELVAGRQPLVVLRGLASLLDQGAIGFQRTPTDPAPPPAPLASAPPKPVEAPPAASIPPVGPTTVAASTVAAAAGLGPPAPTASEPLAPAAPAPPVGPPRPSITSAPPGRVASGARLVPPITAPPPPLSRPPAPTAHEPPLRAASAPPDGPPPATAPAPPAAAPGTVPSPARLGAPAEAGSRVTAARPVESPAGAAAPAPAAPRPDAVPPPIRGAEPHPRTASGSEVAPRAAVAATVAVRSGTPSAETPVATQARRPGRREALRALRSTRLLIVALALVPLALVIVANLWPLTPEGVPLAAPTAAVPPAAAPAQAQAPEPTPATSPTMAPTLALAPAPQQAPTAVPALAQPVTAPPAAIKPSVAPSSVAVTPAPAAQAAQAQASPVAASALLLDERFSTSPPGWPNAPTSSSWWDAIGYHLEPRIAGQHVATAAPGSTTLGDFSLTALFRKLGGPAGGGYGLILRAQGGAFDGTNQGGRYYVFEVGDRGDVGAWRREEDHWVDLLAWTHSDAVHPGASENRLVVLATGSRFTFSVNDVQVAQVTDATLPSGAVGVYTGGDGNQVLLERFTLAGL